jgi:hypothetical protein
VFSGRLVLHAALRIMPGYAEIDDRVSLDIRRAEHRTLCLPEVPY